MRYKTVDSLGLMPTDEEKLLFELNWLRHRVRNLELIVHELMRDRINPEISEAWLKSAHDKGGFTPSVSQIEGRGKHIAEFLDVWPASEFATSQWPAKPDLKEPNGGTPSS